MRSIKEASEEELAAILTHLEGKKGGDHPTVLVGGWAVYAYNPYEKSTDIDLVLGSKRRTRLMHWLRTERGYIPSKKVEHGWQGADKTVPGVGRMVVDVAGYEEVQRLEGRDEALNFDLVRDHHVVREVSGLAIRIPTRSLLVLFKAKAVHDRTYRLDAGTSHDRTWEEDKRVKDRSDILALLDSGLDGPDWEVGFLGQELERLPFLVGVLAAVPEDTDAVARYDGLQEGAARERMAEFLDLVT